MGGALPAGLGVARHVRNFSFPGGQGGVAWLVRMPRQHDFLRLLTSVQQPAGTRMDDVGQRTCGESSGGERFERLMVDEGGRR